MIAMKSCTKCKNYRPKEQFANDKSRRDGKHPHCRQCVKKYDSQRWATDEFREKRYKYQAEKWSSSEKYRTSRRNQRMKLRYGVVPAQRDAMFDAQSGRCAICKRASKKSLQVDHCHSTGVFRGLLCGPCNMAIGLMQDDPSRLLSAAEYVGCIHHESKC